MAKAKAPPGVQNKPIYTRASYLYQAAAYLATASLQPKSHTTTSDHFKDANGKDKEAGDVANQEIEIKTDGGVKICSLDASKPESTTRDQQRKALRNMSRSLLADMRAVSLKVLIRQRPELKRSICRYCDSLLLTEASGGSGSTCDAVMENASRGGRKPWADILVVRCRTCGGAKRFPVGEPRRKQLRKSLRQEGRMEAEENKEEEDEKKNSDA